MPPYQHALTCMSTDTVGFAEAGHARYCVDLHYVASMHLCVLLCTDLPPHKPQGKRGYEAQVLMAYGPWFNFATSLC